FLIGGAAADKRGCEPVNLDQTSGEHIVSAGTYQRVRRIHQCAKEPTHGPRCRARLLRRCSRSQRLGSRHESRRRRQSSDLDKLASIRFSSHDRSLLTIETGSAPASRPLEVPCAPYSTPSKSSCNAL